MKRRLLKYLLLALAGSLVVYLFMPSSPRKEVQGPRDYEAIREEGVLRAATEYNAVSFYVDGDTVSGFHYHLIEAFARDHGLQVAITPVMSHEERLQGLADGRFDVIAYGILSTSELKDTLLLTRPIMLNRQVLVQRKATSDDDSLFVKSQIDLAGKTLHVVKGSPIISRIHNLASEIGDTIYIKEVEKYGSEQLIAMVAHGDIDYAVCSEAIAHAAADSLPQIDIHTAISFTQFYSWGVSKQSPVLLDSLDTWLEQFITTPTYKTLNKKYHATIPLTVPPLPSARP
ncbi:MAG: transporter substrate-binding domain-containing protein [Bacteroides sp.]|nr:transporter substrate-binding domain-containing protein [Bacteroides sp.]